MEVGVSIGWQVVVDSKVDSFNIDTSTEDVSGDTDSLVELLEFLVTFDTVTKLVLVLIAKTDKPTVLLERHQSEQR